MQTKNSDRDVEGNKYKFRAECLPDVVSLLSLLLTTGTVVRFKVDTIKVGYPDCVCEIELSEMTLDDLRRYMREVVDGHVMVQTVAALNDYTGERDRTL